MKASIVSILFLFSLIIGACSKSTTKVDDSRDPIPGGHVDIAEQNLLRSMKLTDKAMSVFFTGNDMKMARYYNPYTESRSEEMGSVWMYTSSIEAVNSILSALEAFEAGGRKELYNKYFKHYRRLLDKLFENIEYYAGTFTLTSYTQTKEWTVYGVNRGKDKGTAAVEGIYNVS